MKLDTVRGLVRPVLTIIGFGTISYAALHGAELSDRYETMVAMMIAFWFAVRK